jgi:hypothetical protein
MNKPIIELYEYQIIGQPADTSTILKFGNIDDSPTDSLTNSLSDCSRVSIEGLEDSKLPDSLRSSCDPIRSIKNIEGGAPLKKYKFYDINNLYDNYKFFLSKNTEIIEEITDSSKKLLNDNMDIIIKQQLALIDTSLKKTPNPELQKFKTEIETLDSTGITLLPINNIIQKTEDTALIQKINIKPENKIVMLGDFHGSFHAFFRLLCRFHRYGILNLETFVINESYKIIFLGDILDRGKYALDIINILFKLIAINNNDISNQKIFYNRGNHEVFRQYQHDGGLDEIEKKISMETTKNVTFTKFLIQFNKVLSLLPSALLITCNNTKFWCSHGGFPRLYLTEKIPDDDIVFIADNIPYHKNGAKDIRWSDFGYHSSAEIFPSKRGPGLATYSYRGTMKFLNNNDINFIIRGHQDSYGNSFYFKNFAYNIINVINNPMSRKIDNFLYYNDTSASHIMRVAGPIARMIADKIVIPSIKPEIFPLLTISTNMDAGRTLTADSFALLRFDINDVDETNFTKNTLSIVNNINSLISDKSNKSNINKGNVLLNILNITEDLYKLFNDELVLKLLNFFTNYDQYIKVYSTGIPKFIYDFITYFKDICINLNQIFEELNQIRIYYNKKTVNLITKLIQYHEIMNRQLSSNSKINSRSLLNITKQFNDKLAQINKLVVNIKSIKDINPLTVPLSKSEIDRIIKSNLYKEPRDNKSLYKTPKLQFILNKLNERIVDYNNIEN